MTDNLSRLGRIGASEVAGLVKEYAAPLLEKGMITGEIYDRLVEMPSYLETRYSLAHKLSFDQDKMDKFQEYIENDAMERGKVCEEMVMNLFLEEYLDFAITGSQIRKEKMLQGVYIPMIATLDFVIQDSTGKAYIHECKTTDISIFHRLKGGTPFHYQLQLQMQMAWHNIQDAFITIAGVQTIQNGKQKTYQILESQTHSFKLDQVIIDAIIQSVFWFNVELKTSLYSPDSIFNKANVLKTKADLQMDAFLEDLTTTKEQSATVELSEKISYLEKLKPLLKEFKTVEEEVKSEIRNIMGDSRKLRLSCADNLELIAKYTKPSFFEEESIMEEIKKKEDELERAKVLEVGTPRSKPSLRYEVRVNE